MGLGGQKQESNAPTGAGLTEGKTSRLAHMADAELRKWAKAYGVVDPDKSERATLLQEMEGYAAGILDPDRPGNLPLERPTFKLEDIRKAVPRHCFERNLWHSLTHLFSDLAIIAVLAYASSWIGHPALPSWSSYILWPMYWYAQGAVCTGVWVLAHECGHQSFSESEVANNFFGTILHSALLVPYHSWRITHGKHHNNTGSCENDEVFAPATRSDWTKEMLRETPLAQVWGIFLMLTVGWMPGYLVFGFTGPKKYKGKNVNHFSPDAAFFKEEEKPLIVQSVIAYSTAVGVLAYCTYAYGFGNVAFFYLIPWMIVNYHLVLITFLQHTDVYMPHFRGAEFDFLRGALCTVDRTFGPLLDHTFHHITDTHVCHHLFSKIPFYHAQEATEAFKKVLGPYYLKDETPIAKALYRAFSNCQYIEDTGDIVFYKNKW